MRASTNIRLEIQKIDNLPPLPLVAQQVLEAINDETVSIDELAHMIQRDPILTSRILGLANSAFFGFGRKVYSLAEAIINVLGLDLVQGLTLSMVIGGVFDVKKCPEFDLKRHWSSALATADLAMRATSLVTHEDELQSHHLFLYGLLHNFGLLILVNRFPKVMTEIFNVAKRHPDRRLVYTEQAVLDMDHHQAGAWLADKWQLPDDVSVVIKYHHYPAYRGVHWRAAMLIGVCSRAVRLWLQEQDESLPDEADSLNALGIDRARMENTAARCRAKISEIQAVAAEMATMQG